MCPPCLACRGHGGLCRPEPEHAVPLTSASARASAASALPLLRGVPKAGASAVGPAGGTGGAEQQLPGPGEEVVLVSTQSPAGSGATKAPKAPEPLLTAPQQRGRCLGRAPAATARLAGDVAHSPQQPGSCCCGCSPFLLPLLAASPVQALPGIAAAIQLRQCRLLLLVLLPSRLSSRESRKERSRAPGALTQQVSVLMLGQGSGASLAAGQHPPVPQAGSPFCWGQSAWRD